MPLFLRLEDNFLAAWADDEDLAIAKLSDVQYWMFGCCIVRAEESPTDCCCTMPFVGFGGGRLGLLVSVVKIGDWVRWGRGRVRCLFAFKRPEVEDKARP